MSRLSITVAFYLIVVSVSADERRAPPPKISADQTRGVFFDDLSEAIRGERPSLAVLRGSKSTEAAASAMASPDEKNANEVDDVWSTIISPSSIEDEVKRTRLHYDNVISTPGAFNSGGFKDARLDLSILAMLFAVINEHSGDVRWKDQAAVARDLLARTAFNCKAGSTQVYNEAKLRKSDLQDLVSGTGLTSRDAEAENAWPEIVDRTPLMEYAERLVKSLEDSCRDLESFEENADAIKRDAELLSTVGEVLTQEGMDESDDDDYVQLSHAMVDQTKRVVEALGRTDFETVRGGVGSIRQRCDACHEQYR